MKVWVVSPYHGEADGTELWGEPEAAFADEDEALKYASMGDMEVTELNLEGIPQP